MRKRLLRENRAKNAKKLKNSEEFVATNQIEQDKQELMNCQCIKREIPTVSQLLTQIQELQNTVNSLSDASQFYDPETASSSGATHVPSQPSTTPSPRTTPCRDSGLPHGTRNIVGTSGNGFDRLPAREGPPSALFENSKNWVSSSRGLRPVTGNTMVPEREMRIRQYLKESLIILVELILMVV